MKILLATPICLLLTISSFAQDKADITKEFDIYIEAMQSQDWNYVLDHTYPKMFEMVPRNQMEQIFSGMNNEMMSMEIGKMDLLNISDTYLYGNAKFVEITYDLQMSIILKGDLWNDQFIEQTIQSMKAQYGDATYDKMTRMIIFKGEKQIFAIKDQLTNGKWTYLESNDAQPEFLSKFIPGEVINYFSQ